MFEMLVFFHMASCNVDWQVHAHSAFHCEVEREDARCKIKVQCYAGRSRLEGSGTVVVKFTEEAALKCNALRPGQVKSTALRVESETWAVLSCKKGK